LRVITVPDRADAAAVLTCFTMPGAVAGALVGAVMHQTGPGGPKTWHAAFMGALLGAATATVAGAALAAALRAGINAAA
jgi:hypothetical protein